MDLYENVIMQGDCIDLMNAMPEKSVDLVFADPPYEFVDDPNQRGRFFETIEALVPAWIAPGALLVVHHSPLPHAIWPTELLEDVDRRVYGRSQLSFFRVPGEPHRD